MGDPQWVASPGPGGYEGIPFPGPEFDRWLLHIKRQVWEEGFNSGAYRGQDLDDDYGAENPYWD